MLWLPEARTTKKCKVKLFSRHSSIYNEIVKVIKASCHGIYSWHILWTLLQMSYVHQKIDLTYLEAIFGFFFLKKHMNTLQIFTPIVDRKVLEDTTWKLWDENIQSKTFVLVDQKPRAQLISSYDQRRGEVLLQNE